MSLSISKYHFLLVICYLTIGIQAQEKVTKESNFSTEKTNTSVFGTTVEQISKMPVHNPNYELDTQINHDVALIDDTTPILMPIFKPYLSFDTTPTSSVATDDTIGKLKTIEEIRKELEHQDKS